MKRYAFIDVQNTASTAQNMLGFVIDWKKLLDYLKNQKSCLEVIFYTGIENGDMETAEEFDSLNKISGCTIKSKAVFAYKNKDKIVALKCLGCEKETVHTIPMGYRKKSNCDVELSVDVIEKSGSSVEFFIFTGNGDFEYLIRKALEKGVDKINVFAYAGKDMKAGVTKSTFSTKLKSLVTEEKDKVFYTSIKDIMGKIKKEIPVI